VDVDIFGRTAENVAQYMKKGRPILIEGRLRLDQWDDKQTGQKRSKLGVVGEVVQFLGSSTGGAGGEGGESPAPRRPSAPSAPAPSSAAEPDMPPPDDDVPF
jgi:single-strand DNA-binding protein